MENYTIILLLLGVMVLLSTISDKIKVASPILLICAGIGMGFLPGMPPLQIDPEIIFLLFLPPLLYDAAFNISQPHFKTNFGTISALAIGLVFLTTAGIAVIARYTIPGMTWPVAFVLGAILAATDAVAAIGITKNLGLTHNTVTVLEGESLINDASALVAYRFAVAAVTGITFVWWKAALSFAILMAGGALTGLLMGKLLGILLRFVRKNSLAVLSYTLLAPFVTYLVAEEFHFSGIIAVVVLGLAVSRLSAAKFPEHLRQQSHTIWSMIVFLLNGLIFIIIGLELPMVIRSIDSSLLLPYMGYALLISIVALLIRMLMVFRERKSVERVQQRAHQIPARRRVYKSVLLTVKESLIIGLSGMRGIVSLAIAVGLPVTLESGADFPMRNAIIFISTMVVLITILGQGLLLPVFIKRLNVRNSAKAA
ncbi:Na+/H+ antiporter [Pedobacter sp. BS3]|uniref:Na+/H+ antiporter n=1 Tax=Pedobacter sp. BS3 TaxID=2567937 RepID=UPI0011EC032B|nr:Na+/H+ antiporter [Pedobacter sp. BS3]TZF80998.1 Na+/H+ antiporter [Pedobacter sp. BS3]